MSENDEAIGVAGVELQPCSRHVTTDQFHKQHDSDSSASSDDEASVKQTASPVECLDNSLVTSMLPPFSPSSPSQAALTICRRAIMRVCWKAVLQAMLRNPHY